MDASKLIKILLLETGTKQQDLQELLQLSSKQAVNNKFSRNAWSVKDLDKVVKNFGGEIVIRLNDKEFILD